jgi:predicted amidohydrolase
MRFADDGSLDEMLLSLASDTVTTIVGFTEIDRDQRLFNSAAVYHRGEWRASIASSFPPSTDPSMTRVKRPLTIIRSDVAGRTSQFVAYGTTAIVDPDGTILGAVEPCHTGLIVAEIEATPGALRTPAVKGGAATARTGPP